MEPTIRTVIGVAGVTHPFYSPQDPDEVRSLIEMGQEKFGQEDGPFIPAMARLTVYMRTEDGDHHEVPCWIAPSAVIAVYGNPVVVS